MSDHLEDMLTQYLDWLLDNKHPIADALQPGLSQLEIDQLTVGLPFTLTDEINTFYRWRNGVPMDLPMGLSRFIPYFSFLPLEDAVQTYHEAVSSAEYLKAMAQSDPSLRMMHVSFMPTWFPVFVLSDPDYLFIDCSQVESERGNVIEVTEGAFPKVVASSLTQMLEQLLASYRARRYIVTEDGDFKDRYSPTDLGMMRPKVINSELESSLIAAAHDWAFVEGPAMIKRLDGTPDVRTEILDTKIAGTGLDGDPIIGSVRVCHWISHPKADPEIVEYPSWNNNAYLWFDGQWIPY